jgi:hypothetical protein
MSKELRKYNDNEISDDISQSACWPESCSLEISRDHSRVDVTTEIGFAVMLYISKH